MEWANKLGSKRIALQFDDSQLHRSAQIAADLAKVANVYVLADSTFGSCCVDTVAAAHINCDLLIHYGPACLSKPSCHYPIFDEKPADIAMLKNSFDAFANNQYVLVYYDVSYYYCIAALKESLENHRIFPFIIWTQIDTCHNIDNGKDRSLYNHFHGRYYTLPGGVLLDDVSVFFIGPSSLLLTHITMYHTRSGRILYIDPSIDKEAKEAVLANKHFMRRYALVQKAKDANVIGIVIGTLGVASYLDVIDKLKQLIISKGKKPYLIAVGKPNPAKLGNFLEIDVFCIVSCAENALIDSKEYLKPLITPFELTLALDPSSGWNVDDYELDICNLDSAMEKTKLSINTTDDDDAPYFSLSTGKLVKKSTISNAIIYSEENSALVSRDTYTVSKIDNYFAASRFLAERTFQGLEQKIGETPVLVATEGRKGIAKGYQNEIDGLTLDIISAKVEQL